jgi:GlpG protein
MRLIGYLPTQTAAYLFSHFLRHKGITNELEQDGDGWAVWVHSEDELDQARRFLLGYLGNPDDPKFKIVSQAKLSTQAGSSRKYSPPSASIRKDRARRVSAGRTCGPFTLALVVASVGIALLSEFGQNVEMLLPLYISPFVLEGSYVKWQTGLSEFLSGEFWRVFSPILVHYGPLHLIFNMFWLVYLGSMVEARERTIRLVGLVLFIAAISNYGQYLLSGPNFGGMSGVIYGLLGYVWMKCRFQPGSGYSLHLHTVTLMLTWFFICLAGIIPNVANGAHAFGLLAGGIWGFVSSKRQAWKAARA